MQKAKKILLVEDEPHLAFNLQFNLQNEGYEVHPAVNGKIALEKFFQEEFDLIILDCMLPELNGFEVAVRVRKQNQHIHILMLTALGREEDRLRGFESGIDDYITKPFHLKELLLRVSRMITRSELFGTSQPSNLLQHENFELDPEILTLKAHGKTVGLTALEADVLKEFMMAPDKVLSREYLLEKVWGMKGDIETRTVDNFIVRLRKHMEIDPKQPTHLISVRGRGYRLVKSTPKKD